MSKFKNFRIVNLFYDDKNNRIIDLNLDFDSTHTLVFLENCGGKSTMIQLMLSPFMASNYREMGNRPFSDFFQYQTPTTIVVQMSLDNSKKNLMVGEVIRKNRSANDENDYLEEVRFIAEVPEDCAYDISKIPFSKAVGNKYTFLSFMECKKMLNDYEDKYSNFWVYDINESKTGKYFAKLKEYGIDHREYETIHRKMNLGESNLKAVFEKEKTERALVENKLLQAIHDKLTYPNDTIRNFVDLLNKIVTSSKYHEKELRQIDSINAFKTEATRIEEQCLSVIDAEDTFRKKQDTVVCYKDGLQELKEELDREIEKNISRKQEAEADISLNEYRKLSKKYYENEAKLSGVNDSLAFLRDDICENKALQESLECRLNIFRLADKQQQTDNAYRRYQKEKEALEICKRNDDGLLDEKNYLGYRLRTYYEETDAEKNALIEKKKQQICAIEDAIKSNKAEAAENQKKIDRLLEQKGEIKASITSYNDAEDNFNREHNESFARNIVGEYSEGQFEKKLEEVTEKINGIRSELDKTRITCSKIPAQIREQEEIIKAIQKNQKEHSIEQNNLQNTEKEYNREIEERRYILRSVSIPEEDLFDTERIKDTLERKIGGIILNRDKMIEDNSAVKQKIIELESGRTMKLPKDLEQALEDTGIHIVYGLEWLKNNAYTEEENSRLVDENPYLPYSLIMSENEYTRLLDAKLGIYTSFPVPIVIREKIGEDSRKNSLSESVKFYVLFNKSLLNESQRAMLLEKLHAESEALKRNIAVCESECAEYNSFLSKLNAQKVTKTLLEETRQQLERIREKIELESEKEKEASEKLSDIQNSQFTLQKNMSVMEKTLEADEKFRRDIHNLQEKYIRYCDDLKKNAANAEKLDKYQRASSDLKKNIAELEKEEKDARKAENTLANEYEKIQEKNAKYHSFADTTKPAGFDCPDDYALMEDRFAAILEKEGKEMAVCLERTTEAERDYQNLLNSLNRYASEKGLNETEWKDVTYRREDEAETERELREAKDSGTSLSGDEYRLEAQKERISDDMERCIEKMKKACGKGIPLEKNEIPNVDFKQEEEKLKKILSDVNDEGSTLNAKAGVVDKNLLALSEYDNLKRIGTAAELEDFRLFSEKELHGYTGKIRREYTAAKDSLAGETNKLSKVVGAVINMEQFRGELFRDLPRLADMTDNAQIFLANLKQLLNIYDRRLEKALFDTADLENGKKEVTNLIFDYVKTVYVELGKIDKHSTAKIRGRSLKMLRINHPDWSENQDIYRSRTENFVQDVIKNGMKEMDGGKMPESGIAREVTTVRLFDEIVGVGNVKVQIEKIENGRERLISWNDAKKSSGAESTLASIVVLLALLYYMRHNDSDIFASSHEGMSLILDNPFAETYSPHMLQPLFEIADAYNTQLLCYSGIKSEDIFSRFHNIYELSLIYAGENVRYMEAKHVADSSIKQLEFAHIQVVPKEERVG